jgi:hypothetical protein
MLKRGPLPALDGKQPEDGGKAQAEELWAKAVQSKRPPVMISSDDALIQVSTIQLYLCGKKSTEIPKEIIKNRLFCVIIKWFYFFPAKFYAIYL